MTTQVRAEREQRESQGVLRDARSAHVGRGDVLNYYEDLGISTTEEGAGSIRADERAFEEEVSDYRGQLAEQQTAINQASGRLESAYSEQSGLAESAYSTGISLINKDVAGLSATIQADRDKLISSYDTLKTQASTIPTAGQAADTAWSSANNGIVRVVNKDGTIEQEYILPRDSLGELGTRLSEGGVATALFSEGYYLNVVASKEIHEALGSESQSYKDKFYASALTTAASEIEKANAQVDSAYAELDAFDKQLGIATSNLTASQQEAYSAQQGAYNTQMAGLNAEVAEARAEINRHQALYYESKSKVDASVAKRAGEWKVIRDNYQDKLETMRDIFSNFSVTQGGQSNDTTGTDEGTTSGE